MGFRFCQQCGYQRRTLAACTVPALEPPLDVSVLDKRLSEIASLSASSKYSKQKSSLQKELEAFLLSLPQPHDLASVCPADLCRFLAWKDCSGKTQVHRDGCECRSRRGVSPCGCPVRLAFGTVDSLLGKLRSIFNEYGRRGDWDPRLLVGNPATDISLKRYLKAVTAEQLQARALPKQATPFFLHDLMNLSQGLSVKLASPLLSPIERFCVLRDQAFFKLLFFSGDRPGDLGQLKTEEIVRFPKNDGLLFNHSWGKTLRDGSSNLFGVRRSGTQEICPVYAIDLYVSRCQAMGVDLTGGYLFRPTTPDHGVSNRNWSSSAAEYRFKSYLREFGLDGGFTLHGFRSGCAITLALSGVELQEIMSHVGWRSPASACHYMQLSKVMSANSPSARLTGTFTHNKDPGQTYQRLNTLQGFTPAFPRPK